LTYRVECMTLVKDAEKNLMASRGLSKPKTQSKTEAARTIASIIEEQMSECGLSEREKNKRVKSFGKRVDRAIQLHAKRS
jgi:hypothetical protein